MGFNETSIRRKIRCRNELDIVLGTTESPVVFNSTSDESVLK